MNKNSIVKDREKQIVLVVAGVLILLFAYNFIFVNFGDKTYKIKENIQTLKAQKAELEEHAKKLDQYESEIVSNNSYAELVFGKIPKNITMDSTVSFLIDFWKDYSVSLNSITLGDPALFYTFQDTGSTIEAAGGPTNGEVYATSVNLSYSTSYKTLKQALEYITNNDKVLLTIESVDMSYSADTGEVTGNCILTAYTTNSELGRDYVTPDFKLDHGVSNLFGTYK